MVAPVGPPRQNNITSTSDGGFPPPTWGPGLWRMMHLAALVYPVRPTEADRRATKTFFLSLQFVIPCWGCRQGYIDLLNNKLPLTDAVLRSRDALFRWTVALHDAVNAKLGKPTGRGAAQWANVYEKMRSG